jgi:hypothetical protein
MKIDRSGARGGARNAAAINGWTPQEVAARVMKLAEETGEAIAAYLGMTGQKPPQGHRRQ